MIEIKLTLVDPNLQMCINWRKEFAGLPNVEIVNGYFETIKRFDCMVSAANSFGLMDGGVDAAITRFFGENLMKRVQERILIEFLGEQPVGSSFVIQTGHLEHPFLAHTPTMRVPMPISSTDYTYLAMKAMLLAIRSHNLVSNQRIEVIACPGLGTGIGQMRLEEAARQMALAYRNFLFPPESIDWNYAIGRQDDIQIGGDLGFLAIRQL